MRIGPWSECQSKSLFSIDRILHLKVFDEDQTVKSDRLRKGDLICIWGIRADEIERLLILNSFNFVDLGISINLQPFASLLLSFTVLLFLLPFVSFRFTFVLLINIAIAIINSIFRSYDLTCRPPVLVS